MNHDNMAILRSHLFEFIKRNEDELRPSKDSEKKIQVRCPVCKDSQYSKSKRRGVFFVENDGISYLCKNDGCRCGVKSSFKKFLEREYPADALRLNRELLYKVPVGDYTKTPDFSSLITKKKEEEDPKVHYRKFVPITSDCTYGERAIEECKKRLIPESVWSNWFVANEGKYKGRMIITFRNKANKIYYFQGRTLIGADPKYLNKIGEKKIYNIDFVNPDKMVFAFEGVIDSLHCENSVAFLGLGDHGLISELLIKFPNICFVLDDDQAGRTKAQEFLKQGRKVFLWRKFKEKYKLQDQKKWDLNEAVKVIYGKEHTFKISEMEKYVARSPWDGFYL